MNELVHWILHSRSLFSARLPSVAGSGLPERMRSTAFALLGLTAAAGLALVAVFAQLSFPLLEPAPLPAEPTVNESVAAAEKVAPDRSPVALLSARPALPARSPRHGAASPGRSDGAVDSPVGVVPAASVPGGSVAPAPTAVPESSSGNKNGGGGAGGEPGGSKPAPTAAPEPSPVSVPEPTRAAPPAPVPVPKPPAPPPMPITAAPEPEPVGPGNSSSAAAAEHASERGIEASAGKGYGKGQDK